MELTYVALLRGINVGGKNKLPMKELAALFSQAGCAEVRTFIQSGNVVFKARPRQAARIPAQIAAAVAASYGYQTPVVLRTTAELEEVASNNPFQKPGAIEDELHVLFLADRPTAERIAALDPLRSAPDQFAVRGQNIYLRLPNGARRTKLTNAYFDSRLKTVSTGRNWRTVSKLLELMTE